MRPALILLKTMIAMFALAGSAPASADDHADAADCSVRSTNDRVAIVVCKPGLDHEALRTAGESACAGTTGICNAWIWDDAAAAPERAPATDAGLDKDRVREAVAVWVNDSSRLMVLQKKDEPRPAT